MKVLIIVPSYPKFSGVDYHRLIEPHNAIGNNYEDCEISLITELDSVDDDFIQGFDLVVANRFISKTMQTDNLINKLIRCNVPYVLDLDDDYKIPNDHILHQAHKVQKHSENIIKGAKAATAVTCTHQHYAATIGLELGIKNTFVVPNGINPVGQFAIKKVEADSVMFGWSGSITHFDDVLLMYDALYHLYGSEYKDKFRMVYGGYYKTDVTSQAIAGVLSGKGKADPTRFVMFPSKEVFNYGEFYDLIQVALIPLKDTRFNNMKSNLKLLEAGFKKKAVIVSDVFPYKPLLNHGKNCLVVKKKADWFKNMKMLIENPAMIEDLGEQLYRDVQGYHIDQVAEARYKMYKEILK